MRRLEYGERLAVGFIGSGCALGALLGLVYDRIRNRHTTGGRRR